MLDDAAGLGQEDPSASPTIPYDPEAARARFASTPVAVAQRQMKLIGPLAAFIGKVVLDKAVD